MTLGLIDETEVVISTVGEGGKTGEIFVIETPETLGEMIDASIRMMIDDVMIIDQMVDRTDAAKGRLSRKGRKRWLSA
jgi:hypothetical protein